MRTYQSVVTLIMLLEGLIMLAVIPLGIEALHPQLIERTLQSLHSPSLLVHPAVVSDRAVQHTVESFSVTYKSGTYVWLASPLVRVPSLHR